MTTTTTKKKKKKKKKKMMMMMMMMMMRACSCYADRRIGQHPSVINLRDGDSHHDNDGKSKIHGRFICLSPSHCFT